MLNLVRKAKRQKTFFDATSQQRGRDERNYESIKTNMPPAFNRRLYSVQGAGASDLCAPLRIVIDSCHVLMIAEGVVITGASTQIMLKNEKNVANANYNLGKSELLIMRTVVEGDW